MLIDIIELSCIIYQDSEPHKTKPMKYVLILIVALIVVLVILIKIHNRKPRHVVTLIVNYLRATERIKLSFVPKVIPNLPQIDHDFETVSGKFFNPTHIHIRSRYSLTAFEIYKTIEWYLRHSNEFSLQDFNKVSNTLAVFHIKQNLFKRKSVKSAYYRVVVTVNRIRHEDSPNGIPFSLTTIAVSYRDQNLALRK